MRALVAAVKTRGDVQPALAFCIERFVLESDVLAVNLKLRGICNEIRIACVSEPMVVRDWNFDQDGRTHV